jgi:hypothetical protein
MVIAACLVVTSVHAQSLLSKTVSLNASRQKLGAVLKSIEQQGGFYFSYPANTIKTDSMVSISVQKKTVRQTLDLLFEGSLEYDETDKHVILRKAPQQSWYASGYVYDRLTGEKISHVSVYERRQLVSTMTNDQGFYRLKLKDKSQPAQISISKAWYVDTTITLRAGAEQELTVSIEPRELTIDTIEINPNVENSWLGKFLLSSKQKMQSINMSKFFVEAPYQASVIPGIGTQGRMAPQIVNKISFNMLGGYSAGTNGAELAGIFNINKKDAKYTQIAGMLNVVGGNVYGTQIGGVYNHVLDSVEGVQIAGFGNYVDGSVHGTEIGGAFNLLNGDMKGSQVTGGVNIVNGKTEGLQIGGIANFVTNDVSGAQIVAGANIAAQEMNGVQIGGMFNYAKKMNGVQIGLFNYADTSTGFSLGFLSFVRKGYHKVSLSTNEVFNANLSFKTGNTKYYSLLYLSANLGKDKAYSYGYGIGTEIKLAKRLALAPELSAHFIYAGSWDVNILARGSMNLQYKFGKYFSVFAGPTYSMYYSDQKALVPDFKVIVPTKNVYTGKDNVPGWIGWNVGVNIF